MVGAVHLRMTIQATASQHHRRGTAPGQAAVGKGKTGMPSLRVTRLAQQRRASRQQGRMNRAMRLMTQRTIFADRGMIEYHRAAQLGMTTKTQFVQRIALQLTGRPRRMRTVTIRADHRGGTNRLIGAKRMRGRFHAIRALLPMAGKADLGLTGLQSDRIRCRMHAMATGAPRIITIVHAARPRETDIALMAIHANQILLIDRRSRIGTESDDRLMFCAPPGMFAAGTMTVFTLQLRQR